MLAWRLLLTISVAGLVLLTTEILRLLIQRLIVRRFDLGDKIEVQLIPPLLISFVFIVLLPSVVYAALYPILPFTSYRSGFFIALFVYSVGLLPVAIRHFNQYKLSAIMTGFELFWNLLTLLAVIGTITHLYHY